MASKRAFALAFVSFTLFASPLFAQTAEEKQQARALMDEGDQKRDAKDYKAALAAYEKADGIMHVPSTGLEVARMQAQLGMLLEAKETVTRVKNIPAKDKEPQAFVNARKAAEQLNEELGRRTPSLQVVITGLDAGQTADVTVDNEAIPAASLGSPKKVNPGLHTVVVKSAGKETKVEVTVAERETKSVPVELKPEPQRTVKMDTTNVDDSATPKILMYGGFALAVVGIGVGSVTGLMSMSKVDDIKGSCNPDTNKCPTDKAGDIDDAKMLGNISTLGFAAGGLGVVVGVVGIIMNSGSKESPSPPPGASAKSSPRVKTQPVVGAGYLGLSGSF